MKYLLLILLCFFQTELKALQYNSKILRTKDYEEMRNILKQYIKKSQNSLSNEGEDSAILELKKGLKILLMRPDTDAIKSSLVSILQNEIIKYKPFMEVLHELTETSSKELKSKKGSLVYQASLLYTIENTLSYLQAISNKESTNILKSVKKANLKISDKLSRYLLLEMERGETASPSYLAGQILKKREKEMKKKAKKERARKKLEMKKAKKEKARKKLEMKKSAEESAKNK